MSTAVSDVQIRVREAELMDDPRLDRAAHVQALRGLARIYAVSLVSRIAWPYICAEARRTDEPLRILDLATGGGDWPLDLARRAKRAGLRLQIDACDVSRTAVAFARLRARRARADVRFFLLDACEGSLPGGYHVITSGLFLHHLSEPRAVSLLRDMAAAAERLVLVDDLRRSRLALWLAWTGTRLLTRSRIVHVDGVRSVRAAFTHEELLAMAKAAGLEGASIVPHVPERQLLVWRRETQAHHA